MSQSFEIRDGEHCDGVATFHLNGRLEAQEATLLRERCFEVMDEGVSNVIIVLSDVSFVASSGIGCLLVLSEKTGAAGGRLLLASPSEAVACVIKLLNLGQLLEVVDSLDEARSRFMVGT